MPCHSEVCDGSVTLLRRIREVVKLARRELTEVWRLKQRSVVTCSCLGSSCSHACQRCRNSSGILSSQPYLLRQRSCRISFALRINGATNSKGSYTKLIMDNRPLLVAGLSLMTISEDAFHCTPRAHSTGNLLKSRVLT